MQTWRFIGAAMASIMCVAVSTAEEMTPTDAFASMLLSRHPFSTSVQQQSIDKDSREGEASISQPDDGGDGSNKMSANNSKSDLFPPIDTCDGTCSASVYFGVSVDDGLEDIVFNDQISPFDWVYRDTYLLAFSFSKRVMNISDLIHVEPEIGAAKRFGDEREFEIWVALYFRWVKFPWNNFIKTKIGVSTGFNYATGIPEIEIRRAGGKKEDASRVMHFLSPELTFAHPDYEDEELFVRFHHRSGAYGFINDAGGEQFIALGFRHYF